MTHKRVNQASALMRRMRRVERKCDLILARLRAVDSDPVDAAIERLHRAAAEMRRMSAAERRCMDGNHH